MRRMTLWRRGVTAHQPRGWQLTLAFRRLHSTSGSSGPGLTPRALMSDRLTKATVSGGGRLLERGRVAAGGVPRCLLQAVDAGAPLR